MQGVVDLGDAPDPGPAVSRVPRRESGDTITIGPKAMQVSGDAGSVAPPPQVIVREQYRAVIWQPPGILTALSEGDGWRAGHRKMGRFQ